VRLEERLLHGVLGVRRGPRYQERGPEGDVIVLLDQHFVCLGVSGASALRELMVFQWTALHGVLSYW
jgi:hypothetical protein